MNFTKNEKNIAILAALILILDSYAVKLKNKEEQEPLPIFSSNLEESLEVEENNQTLTWQNLANRYALTDMDELDIMNVKLTELTIPQHSIDASIPPLPITMNMIQEDSQEDKNPEKNPEIYAIFTPKVRKISRKREHRTKNN